MKGVGAEFLGGGRTVTANLMRSSMLLLSRLDVQVDPVNMDAAVVLAAATRLSVYDACYLWLARTLRAELVTLDKQLAAAARR